MNRENRKKSGKGQNDKSRSHHSLTSEDESSGWSCKCDECKEFVSSGKNSKGSSSFHNINDQFTISDNYENIDKWPSVLPTAPPQEEFLDTAFEPATTVSIVHLESGHINQKDDTETIFENEAHRRKYRRKDPSKKDRLCGKQCELEVKSDGYKLQPVDFDNYENIRMSPTSLPPPSYHSSKDAKSSGAKSKNSKPSSGVTSSSEIFYENTLAPWIPSDQFNRQVEQESALMAERGYDNVYPIAKKVLEPEFPPSRRQSLRLDSANSSSSVPHEALNRILEGSTLTAVAPMSLEASKMGETVCDVLKNLSDLKFGKIGKLIVVQIIAALILVVLSLTLSVTGSHISASLFSAAILIVIQLSPSIGCILLDSPHVSFVFRFSTQVCAYFNALWSVVSWMITAENRGFILLAIATLQYGCHCALAYYDYKERNERRLKRELRGKEAGK